MFKNYNIIFYIMQIFKDKNACLNLFQKRTSIFFKKY